MTENTRLLLTEEQEQEIMAAIATAEKKTSGEIRLHVERHCLIEPYKRAVQVFEFLKMHKTKLRNGVLFYLAFEDRKFAVIGDKGINEKVPEGFWDSTKDKVLENFRNERFAEGLACGIAEAGNQLRTHFPYERGDINELTNRISYLENRK